MAWNDLNDMPWLTKAADPAGSFLKGQQIGQMLVEARQQAALQPLKQHLMEQQVKELALKYDTELNAYQYKIKQQEGEAALARVLGSPDFAFTDPKWLQEFTRVSAEHPSVTSLPIWQKTVDDFDKSSKLAQANQKLTDLADYRQAKLEADAAKNAAIIESKNAEIAVKAGELKRKETADQMRNDIENKKLEQHANDVLKKGQAKLNDADYRGLMGKISAIVQDKSIEGDDKHRKIDEVTAQYKLAHDPSDMEKRAILAEQQAARLIKKGYGGGTGSAAAPNVSVEEKVANMPPQEVSDPFPMEAASGRPRTPSGSNATLNPEAVKIRDAFQSGKITREEAVRKLKEMGFR